MRRRALELAAIVALSALWPALAEAHGGAVLASTRAGPFQVTLTAAPLIVPGQREAIDYTAYVNDGSTGEPVADARVTMAVGGRRAAHPPVQLIGGGYEAIMPTDGARARYLTTPVSVALTSPLGRGLIDVTPHGPPSSSAPGWLVPVSVLGGVLLIGVAVRVRRNRADPEQDQEQQQAAA